MEEQPLMTPHTSQAGYRSWLGDIAIWLTTINSIVLILLWALMVFDRTKGNLPATGRYVFAGAALLTFLLTVLAIILHRRNIRHRKSLEVIQSSLYQFAGGDQALEALQKMQPFPVGAQSSSAATGWNNMLTAIDELISNKHLNQAEDGMGQFLCSYDSQRLLGLLDSLPDGIVLADAGGIIILANRSCEGMIGRALSEFISGSIVDLFDDPYGQEMLRNLLQSKSTWTNNYFEVKISPTSQDHNNSDETEAASCPAEHLSEAGTTVLRVSTRRLTDDQDNSDILLTIRDITQQKIGEASRDKFVAHVSHELRSPLTNIRAYSETLLSDMVLDATAQKEAFNVINDEACRLSRLVNDVLDLSQMETGSLSLDKSEVVLDRLIRHCVNDVKGNASAKKITVQTNYHPKLPNLHADREKLAVVINNILTNAIKYTPDEGSVFIETNVDDRFVYIKIADTGYGIEAGDIEKIFEKFYRVDRQELKDIPGTGLGLATCKEIVALHNGVIDVTSQLNKGTEMIIKLPVVVTGPVLGPRTDEQG